MTIIRISLFYCDEPGCTRYIYVHMNDTDAAIEKLMEDGWFVYEDEQGNFHQYCGRHEKREKV